MRGNQCDGGTYSEGSAEPGAEEELFHLLHEELSAPAASRAAGGTRSAASSAAPPTRPRPASRRSCRSSGRNSESKGGSSRPSISFLLRTQNTMCAIRSCSQNPLYGKPVRCVSRNPSPGFPCPAPVILEAMCGRFARRSTQEVLADWFGVELEDMPWFAPSYNVAPQSVHPWCV
jgi:hypothetical protein